jgi:hypothetical protein
MRVRRVEDVDLVVVRFEMGSIVRLNGQLYWLRRGWNRSILARRVRQVSSKRFEFLDTPGTDSILRPDELDRSGEYVGKGTHVVSEHLEIRSTRKRRR